MPAADAKRRAGELLQLVGLGDRFNHAPFALSGGERQRVAIARALANRPELLICDEPTGNLDSANAAAVMKLLLSLRENSGVSLILVTHDSGIAATADRTIRIRDGRVAEDTVRIARAAE
jgi:predicted ABC-type transport system involved in lysophospholipase L1 biosynthesis ATPase subunit